MAKRKNYSNPAFANESAWSVDDESEDPFDIDDKEYMPESTTDRLSRKISAISSLSRHSSRSTLAPASNLDDVSRSSSRRTVGKAYSRIKEEEDISIRRLSGDSVPPYEQYDYSYNSSRDPGAPKPLDKTLATKRRFGGYGLMMIALALFSTVFSALFFLIAAAKPRYQNYISSTGKLSPNSASLMSAIFAKAIELSFVTVFTSCLGQILSRRALDRRSRGITMADMVMKQWVYQPGSLFSNFPPVRYAGPTVLGVVSIFVVCFATFYTTAADSLVSPKLRFGNYESQDLRGYVSLTYANSTALANRCPAIISSQMDGPVNGSALPASQITCYKVHNSYQPLRDFTYFTDAWNAYKADPTIPRNITTLRPPPPTTVGSVKYEGVWLDVFGSKGFNNATVAMPHGGIVPAVQNTTLNSLVQPDPQSDFGNIDITASVISPALNVRCHSLNETSVQWFLQSPNDDANRQGLLDPDVQAVFNFDPNATRIEQEDPNLYIAPRFGSNPAPFNVVIYASKGYADPSVYTLTAANGTSPIYSLCATRSFLTSRCSTQYISATGGGNVTVNCDNTNPAALDKVLASAKDTYQNQFKDICTELLYALSLTVVDAPLSRIFALFALATPDAALQNTLPSLAEAMAVLLSNSLVVSTIGAQFGTDTISNSYPGSAAPYPHPLPTIESFHAKMRTVEYASGVPLDWQVAFYIVLAGVLVTNIFCLCYFLFTPRLVTDWTELTNLFCISLHSKAPDHALLNGTCATGPTGRDFGVMYAVDTDQDHFYIRTKNT